MGDASYKDVTRLHDRPLSDAQATFYVTQRKLPCAPCLGHERLVRLLVDSQIDRPRLRFLEQDRGGLQRFAKAIEDIQFCRRYSARCVRRQSCSRNNLSPTSPARLDSRKRRRSSLSTPSTCR